MRRVGAVRLAAGVLAWLVGVQGCDAVGPDGGPAISIRLDSDEITVVPGQIGPPPYRDPRVYVGFAVEPSETEVTVSVTAANPIIASISEYFPPLVTADRAVGIEVRSGTPAGSYPVTVRATAGRRTAEATFTVVVRTFQMWVYQPTVKVNQGGSNTVSVFFLKDATAVTVTSTGAADLTVVPTMAASAPVAYVDISAAAGAAVGPRTITVTATASGMTESRDIQVIVQAPPPKREIAFRMCRNQLLFTTHYRGPYAYANDGEGWTTVVPDADDMIRFQATERVSFADSWDFRANLYDGGRSTRVLHTTASELEEMRCASASRGTKTFTIDAVNSSPWRATIGQLRIGSTVYTGKAGGVRDGPHDLVAVGAEALYPAIVRRGVDLPSGSTIALDFSGAEAVPLDVATHTHIIPSAGPVSGSVVTYVHTPTTVAYLGNWSGAAAAGKYWALPAALLSAGDIQSVTFRSNSYASFGEKGLLYYFSTATPLTVTFGADLAIPSVDLEAQTITLASQPDYPDLAGAAYYHTIDGRGTFDIVEIWQTKAFLGGTPATWTFTPPDLGRFVVVPVMRTASTAAAAVGGKASLFFGGTPAAGTMLRWGARGGGRFMAFLPFPTSR